MNEQIEQLESQLSEMNRSKRIGIYIVLVISAIYMSWVLVGEELYNEIETTHEQIASLESKLMRNSTRSLESAIVKTKKDNLKLEDEINHLHFQKQFVETKLQGIDFIFYNEQGSAELLDNILEHSVSRAIVLERIQKEPFLQKEEGMLQPKSALSVTGEGSLQSIVSLMHYVESLNALIATQLLHVTIDENNATRFDARFIHYGVEL